ncbi:MAG: helix-turn-helix domain-containing protein [Gemmatimonadaceae bacterium]
MRSSPVGSFIRASRRRLGLSQADLALRVGVSARLVAELERGERPNVSLETTLELFSVLGISVRLESHGGDVVEIRGASAGLLDRQARAVRRRMSWTGQRVALRESGEAPAAGRSAEERLRAVAEVSRQAYAVAGAAKARSTRAGDADTGPTASGGRPAGRARRESRE